jgi:Flp pilus assembly protein TadD
MLGHNPDNTGFMNNIGSYHMLVRKDFKTAVKWYGKVLKKQPGDYTAIKNSVLASRKMGNVKSEKKYLQMLAEHGSETEKLAAQGRLTQLSK